MHLLVEKLRNYHMVINSYLVHCLVKSSRDLCFSHITLTLEQHGALINHALWWDVHLLQHQIQRKWIPGEINVIQCKVNESSCTGLFISSEPQSTTVKHETLRRLPTNVKFKEAWGCWNVADTFCFTSCLISFLTQKHRKINGYSSHNT